MPPSSTGRLRRAAVLAVLLMPPTLAATAGATAEPFSPREAVAALVADPSAVGAAALSVADVGTVDGLTEIRGLAARWEHVFERPESEEDLWVRVDLSVPTIVLEDFRREGEGYAASHLYIPVATVAALLEDGIARPLDVAFTQHGLALSDWRWRSLPSVEPDPERPVSSVFEPIADWMLDLTFEDGAILASTATVEDAASRLVSQQGPVALGAYRGGALASFRGSPSVTVLENLLAGEDGSLPPVERYEIGAQTMAEGLDLAPLVEALLGGNTPAGTVRPMLPRSRTDGLTATIGDLDLSVGDIVFDGLSVRQPEEPLLAVLDDLATGALDPDDDIPTLVRRLSGFLRTFGYTLLSVEEVTVEAPDVAFRLALAESRHVSRDGIGRLAVEDVTLLVPGEDSQLLLGLLEIAEVRFPALADILAFAEAMAAAEATPAPDDGPGAMETLAINPTIGRYALERFDVSTPRDGRVRLDAVRLEQEGFIGPIPTDVRLAVEGLSVPVALLAEPAEGGPPPAAAAFLHSLGLDTLALDGRLSVRWDEASEGLAVGPFEIAVSRMGSLSAHLEMDGLPRFVIENPNRPEAALASLAFSSFRLDYEDDGLVDRLLASAADEAGVDRQVFAASLVAHLRAQLSGLLGDTARVERLADAFGRFLRAPDRLTVAAEPAAPVALAQILGVAAMAPGSILSLIGLTVESNGGG